MSSGVSSFVFTLQRNLEFFGYLEKGRHMTVPGDTEGTLVANMFQVGRKDTVTATSKNYQEGIA